MVENKNIVLRQFSTTTTTTHTRLCCRCSRRRLLSDWRITSNASSVVFSHFLVVDCVLKESQREEKKKRDRDRLSRSSSRALLSPRYTEHHDFARALYTEHTSKSRAFFFECRRCAFLVVDKETTTTDYSIVRVMMMMMMMMMMK